MAIGRILVVVGGITLLVGVLLLVFPQAGRWFGRLPGDLVLRGERTTVWLPLMTCALLSAALSLVAYLLRR